MHGSLLDQRARARRSQLFITRHQNRDRNVLRDVGRRVQSHFQPDLHVKRPRTTEHSACGGKRVPPQGSHRPNRVVVAEQKNSVDPLAQAPAQVRAPVDSDDLRRRPEETSPISANFSALAITASRSDEGDSHSTSTLMSSTMRVNLLVGQFACSGGRSSRGSIFRSFATGRQAWSAACPRWRLFSWSFERFETTQTSRRQKRKPGHLVAGRNDRAPPQVRSDQLAVIRILEGTTRPPTRANVAFLLNHGRSSVPKGTTSTRL